MRTFSKILSLVLVLAMMVGLCAFGATAEFKDQDQIEYPEACAVLNGIEVLLGDADTGNFRPKDGLKRAEACVILAKLLGYPEGSSAASGFADCAGHWGEKYIALCVNEGIVSGYGDGNFGPNDKLTGSAFTLMCLRALGFEPEKENIGGPEWEVQTAKLVKQYGLAAGIAGFDAPAELTREQAAQIALNTLQATEVFYGAGTGTDANVNWQRQSFANKSGKDYADRTDEATLQLCEDKFPTLKLNTKDSEDAFGRPADHTWMLGETPIYVAAADAVVSYTSKQLPTTVAKDLKAYEVKSGTSFIITNGTSASLASKDDIASATDNGFLVEVYADADKVITNVVVVKYETAMVTNVTKNSAGDITYVIGGYTVKEYADEDKADEISYTTAPAPLDVVTCVKVGTVLYVYETTKIEGTQTANNGTTVTIDGTKYTLGAAKTGDFKNSSTAANYFLDQYGYLVFTFAAPEPDQYAVVDRIALVKTGGTAATQSIEAVLAFADGTVETVQVGKIGDTAATDYSDAIPAATNEAKLSTSVDDNTVFTNKIVTYTVNAKGVYTLKYIDPEVAGETAAGGTATTKGTVTLTADASVKLNNKTIFLVETGKYGSTQKFTAYTGYAEVPTLKAKAAEKLGYDYALVNGVAAFVYINAAGDVTEDAIAPVLPLLYVFNNKGTVTGTGPSATYTLTGVVDGVITDLTTPDSGSPLKGAEPMKFYDVKKTTEGDITELVPHAAETCTAAPANGVLGTWAYDGTEKVFVINAYTGEVSEGAITSLMIDDQFVVIPAGPTAPKNTTIGTLYILKF